MIMEGIDLIYGIKNSIERTAVSGKTNYLVAGFEMDDGRAITEGAKYKEAKKKNVKIISDEDLMKMITDSIKDKKVQEDLNLIDLTPINLDFLDLR